MLSQELAVKVQKMPNTGTNTADHDKFKNSHAESMSGVVVSRAGVRNSIPLGHDALDHVAVRITERTGHKSMRNGIAPIIRSGCCLAVVVIVAAAIVLSSKNIT